MPIPSLPVRYPFSSYRIRSRHRDSFCECGCTFEVHIGEGNRCVMCHCSRFEQAPQWPVFPGTAFIRVGDVRPGMFVLQVRNNYNAGISREWGFIDRVTLSSINSTRDPVQYAHLGFWRPRGQDSQMFSTNHPILVATDLDVDPHRPRE